MYTYPHYTLLKVYTYPHITKVYTCPHYLKCTHNHITEVIFPLTLTLKISSFHTDTERQYCIAQQMKEQPGTDGGYGWVPVINAKRKWSCNMHGHLLFLYYFSESFSSAFLSIFLCMYVTTLKHCMQKL